jgi:lactate dehydrogenase-like 2-hydroxyacid dehydrogenase
MSPASPDRIKLAILDDYQGIAAPHFECLKASFEVTVFRDTLLPYNHPSTSEAAKQALVDRLKPFTVISTMRERTPFPAELQDRLPNLKLLLSSSYRNLSIDNVAAKRLGIPVTGAKGTGRTDSVGPKRTNRGVDSTTQHAIALILGIARNIASDDKIVKEGGWQTELATGLNGKVFATLGLGKLGSKVAKILHSIFGMRVIAWSSNLTQDAADQKATEAGLPVETDGEKTFLAVSKEELFKQADVFSIHSVLSERSRGIVGGADLALMKKTAMFINTSRGPLVDEGALLKLLKEGRIRGAAIDVYNLEPLPEDSEWRHVKWGENGSSRVLLSPHMGYVEEETMHNWYDEQAEIAEKWLRGEPLLNLFYD